MPEKLPEPNSCILWRALNMSEVAEVYELPDTNSLQFMEIF
jgi:hypothetical protein